MKRFLIIIMVLCVAVGASAQTEDSARQILVFRNTGEVNLFYSNELDSVTTTETAQIFYSADTTLVVPLAELDSVAVGSRNEIVLNKQVRQLTDAVDIPWIIRTDKNSLFYLKDSPASVLPQIGERLYYAEECDLLPYGLAAKVVSVIMKDDVYEVVVEEEDLANIFDNFFYAGSIMMDEEPDEIKRSLLRKAKENNTHHTKKIPINQTFPFDGNGSLDLSGSTDLQVDFVVDVRRHYYHARFQGELSLGVHSMLKTNDSETIERRLPDPPIQIPLPVIAGVLHPRIEISLLGEISAELKLEASLDYKHRFEYVWTRKDGKDVFESVTPASQIHKNAVEAKTEILLNGLFFAGVNIKSIINLPGDRIGAFLQFKGGVYAEGQFSADALRDLRNPNPNLYAQAVMDVGLMGEIAAGVQHREYFLIFGSKVESIAYRHTFKFAPINLPLFPHYNLSRAIAKTDTKRQTIVSMATVVPEPPLTSLETGFEMVDDKNNVVDSLFVGTIEKQKESIKEQKFDAERTLPEGIHINSLDQYKVRPIFHYAGYTVSAEPVSIRKDVNLQPYTSQQSNGALTFISGSPFLGSVKHNETLYTLGLYLPVPPKKRLNEEPGSPLIPGNPISDDKAELIIGTWTGEQSGYSITITFDEDGNGSSVQEGQQARNFQYALNNPQSGEILITYDETSEQLLWRVLSVNETELKIVDKRDLTQKTVTFIRQY